MKKIKKIFLKSTKKVESEQDDLKPKGFTQIGERLPYNDMGAKQYPSDAILMKSLN